MSQSKTTCTCPDTTCDACVRRQRRAAEELKRLTAETRARQFREMIAARQADGGQA